MNEKVTFCTIKLHSFTIEDGEWINIPRGQVLTESGHLVKTLDRWESAFAIIVDLIFMYIVLKSPTHVWPNFILRKIFQFWNFFVTFQIGRTKLCLEISILLFPSLWLIFFNFSYGELSFPDPGPGTDTGKGPGQSGGVHHPVQDTLIPNSPVVPTAVGNDSLFFFSFSFRWYLTEIHMETSRTF